MPGPGETEQSGHQRRRPVRPQINVLEEPLQPAIRRGDQRLARTLAREMAEVDGAGADHAHDEERHRLNAALAEREARI